jgi:CYTH domain-containing protein
VDADALDWRRSPGLGRYAQTERERRFLVSGGAPATGSPRLIEDRYLVGTRLRLRRVTVGGEQVWKLTQKVRGDARTPAEVATTSTYLSGEEYERLLVLPALTLAKTRVVCVTEGVAFAVDTFHGPLAGLQLAEAEVADLATPLPVPQWLGQEVPHDDRYSGGHLAALRPEELAALLPPPG